MNREGLGFVGGLAADRPIVCTLVLAFGLTALAVIGADEAMGAPLIRATMLDFLAGGGAVIAPLVAASLAPARASGRMFMALIIAALAVAVILIQPAQWLAAPAAQASSIAAASALAVVLIVAYPAFGALSRLGFVAFSAALLGGAGAIGLFAMQGQAQSADLGGAAGLALSLGAACGFGVLSDFAGEFAQGADRRAGAGRAAQEGVGSVLFMGVVASAAFGLLHGPGGPGGPGGSSFAAAALAGAAALLGAGAALLVSAGALSLRRASETLAVDENRRRQGFRSYWRAIRRVLSPAAANAFVAIAAIAVMAIALNMRAPVSLSLVMFIVVAGAFAGLILFSLRAGLLVFFSLLVAVVVVKWLWRAYALPDLAPADEAAAMAMTASLYGQLALAWREARSPRLNPRETTEAAMTRGFRVYAVSALVGMAAFFALSKAGVWPNGGLAAAQTGMLLTIGLILGPALMTALSNAVRRELA